MRARLARRGRFGSMKRSVQTVDVFTDRPFGGNPLAVVLDAEGLTTAQMQAIAAEFNYAETTFVLPPKDPAHTAHVRIFTPKAEMPFAGHPNVGTAFVLAHMGRGGDQFVFEEIAGLVPIDVTREARCRRRDAPCCTAATHVDETVAPGDGRLGRRLAAGDIVTASRSLPACGAKLLFAEVTSRAAPEDRDLHADVFARTSRWSARRHPPPCRGGRRTGSTSTAACSRPLYGIPEDPATGAANVALIGVLAHRDTAPTSRSTRRSARASTWAGRACSRPPPRRRPARSSRPISAAAACR